MVMMKTARRAEIPPQQGGAPAAEVDRRIAERAQQEAGVRERDDKAVVPTKRLEKLSPLDHCRGHVPPPVDRSEFAAIAAARR
jgi:hypothetical protein